MTAFMSTTREKSPRLCRAEISSGRSEVKVMPAGKTFYAPWATGVVKDEIHKGGWRLAALLGSSRAVILYRHHSQVAQIYWARRCQKIESGQRLS